MTPMLPPSSAAAILCTTRRRVLRWARQGLLPAVELPNGEFRIPPERLQQWLTSNETAGKVTA